MVVSSIAHNMELDKQKAHRILELQLLVNYAIDHNGEAPLWAANELDELVNGLNDRELDYIFMNYH